MGDERYDGRAHHEPSGQSGQGELVDGALLAETELLSEVIASVTGCPGHLTPDEVDSVLGVPAESRRAAGRSTRIGARPFGQCRCRARPRQQGSGGAPEMMSDLFHPEPELWSARGSLPHRQVWASMRSLLAAEPVPPTGEKVARVFADAFRAVVGVDLTADPLPETSRQVYGCASRRTRCPAASWTSRTGNTD